MSIKPWWDLRYIKFELWLWKIPKRLWKGSVEKSPGSDSSNWVTPRFFCKNRWRIRYNRDLHGIYGDLEASKLIKLRKLHLASHVTKCEAMWRIQLIGNGSIPCCLGAWQIPVNGAYVLEYTFNIHEWSMAFLIFAASSWSAVSVDLLVS